MTKKQHTPPRRQGIIHIASNSVGYVNMENIDEDVQIQSHFLNTALHGDTVEIALLPKDRRDTRKQGEVVKVLERAKKEFTGTIEKMNPKKNFGFLIPDDSRMHIDIFLPNAQSKEIKHNYKALVKIIDWGSTKKNPSGEIIKILGEKGNNDVEMQSILLESGYRPEFSREVIKEAEKIQKTAKPIPQKERDARKNYTDIATFTIDPADAKDLDDALSIKELDNGIFEVGIHIADVSYYVKEDSILDLDARAKGISVYLVDRTAPMFPESLSNDICSLNPKEDKLTFSVVLKISKDGHVRDTWFGKTIINIDKRFSYEEAQNVIDTGNGEHARALGNLNALAKKFQKQAEERGALIFEQEEIQFKLGSTGKPIDIYQKEILASHKLVEEFMILANHEVATYFDKQEKKKMGIGIYRVHDAPKKENVNKVLDFLNVLGYDLEAPEKVITSRELNKIFKAVKGKNVEHLVETTALSDMEKAVYSLDNIGHWGLALKNYTHFTSPIRRYADLMVHRVLEGYIQKNPVNINVLPKYKKLLNELTQKEIDAMGAERNSIKYKQIEYMLERKEQVFEGVIMNIFNWGMFIQEKTTKSEGLVKTRDMQDDYYVLDEEVYALLGARTNKKYSIGDTVKIKVIGGDMDQKKLDYKLIS